MNFRFLLVYIILNSSWTNAQDKIKDNFYLTSDLNLGNYIGIEYNLNYVIQNKYAFKIGFSGNIRKPVSQPDNYSSSLLEVFSSFGNRPYDHFLNYKVEIGRIYNLNKKGTIRANLAFGLGYTLIKEPENWQYSDNSSWINLTENYTYSYNRHQTISLVLSPKIEFPISKYFGFSVSPQMQFNKDRTYVGIGVGTMIGKLK